MKFFKLLTVFVLAAAMLAAYGCTTHDPVDANTTETPEPIATEEPSPEPTAEPTMEPTAEPTAEPTPEVTEEPEQYNSEEASKLRAFFELTDKKGIKNGDKLFNKYDPDDPGSWQIFPAPGNTYEWVMGADWGEDGHLKRLIFPFWEEDSGKYLKGAFELVGFPELTEFRVDGAYIPRLESLTISDCPKLGHVNAGLIKGEVSVDVVVTDMFSVVSRTHFTGAIKAGEDGEDYYVDITAPNDHGYFGINAFKNSFTGEVSAALSSQYRKGYQFEGWYNKDNTLFSEEWSVKLEIDPTAEPPMTGRYELIAVFGEQKPSYPMFEGDAPNASPIIATLDDGELYECDLDFDGLTDTVQMITEDDEDHYTTFTLTIVRGAAPDKPFVYTVSGETDTAGLRIIDTDTSDDRLEVLFNAGGDTAEDMCLIHACRVNAEGTGIDTIGKGSGVLDTDREGWFIRNGTFDATKGIPVKILSDVLGTHYLIGRMTITGRDFRLLEPFECVYSGEATIKVKKDIDVIKLKNGEPNGTATLKKGEKVYFLATDNWSFVDVKTKDGKTYRIEISIVDYSEVIINGRDQEEYFEVHYAG